MKAGKAIAYSFRSQDAKDRGLSRRKDLVALARRVDDRVVALTTPTKQVPHRCQRTENRASRRG